MDREAAESFSSGLGKVMGGSYELILHAKQQRVPEVLGMTLQDWVNHYLGGYMRMAVDQRREAAKELAEEGLSQRAIAEVLGVAQKTVDRDLSESNDSLTHEEPPEHQPVDEDSESNDSLHSGNLRENMLGDDEEIDRETGEVLEDEGGDIVDRVLDEVMNSEPVRVAAIRSQYSSAVSAITNKLVPLNPEVTARVVGDRVGTDWWISELRSWLDRYDHARKQSSTIHALPRKVK